MESNGIFGSHRTCWSRTQSKQFQFLEKTVEFAGFRITEQEVEPLPEYLDSIREYPTLTNDTDIRSWFGLVNQVSHYSQLSDIMEPFKKSSAQRRLSNGQMNWTPFSTSLRS